ncbi:hypothetical protein B0T24DRAFT_676762 [Lasiosphaeria ovina]|uniref:Uncharacterized protein n=1 Tax=Lasiosphaeria ovina TaxID=92902 RepID=A0AAE0KFJ5_9PEZI|nr:hypothetical protein B0T24DRAFT_676762 [Lasiosphaeria ovina]
MRAKVRPSQHKARNNKSDGAWGPERPATGNLAFPYIRDGSLGLLPGVRRFVGPKDIECADGTVLDDVDAVILCTGYSADWGLSALFIETSTLPAQSTKVEGPPKQPGLYLNMSPSAYADSCVVQTHCLFGKNNDVTAWAVGNLWRAPSRAAMEAQVDGHHAWLAGRWDEDRHCDLSAVRQWEYQQWIHGAAGTGMENLGWGWRGWPFWLRDRRMYSLMNHGVETAQAFRFFDMGTLVPPGLVLVMPSDEDFTWPPPDKTRTDS